jgi:hypothetical protein
MATPHNSRAAALFVDTGWGDWRLADNLSTRVTAEQVAVIAAMPDVESAGASEVRFGERTGELCVFQTEGRVTEVAEDGTTETFGPDGEPEATG